MKPDSGRFATTFRVLSVTTNLLYVALYVFAANYNCKLDQATI